MGRERVLDSRITIPAALAFLTDILTLETWAQAEKADGGQTASPRRRNRKAGYSVRMFERVEPGDVLRYRVTRANGWTRFESRARSLRAQPRRPSTPCAPIFDPPERTQAQ